MWSVRLGPNGGFDTSTSGASSSCRTSSSARTDIARAGFSQPVSDISFSECGQRPVMLVAERGGIRNLGLGAENPFANPHEARALRYEVDAKGTWRPVGRYDVGFYDRTKEGAPYMRANCSGGMAFGLGYDERSWTADQGKPDQFVWTIGRQALLARGSVQPADRPDGGDRLGVPAAGCRADRQRPVRGAVACRALRKAPSRSSRPNIAFAPTPPSAGVLAAAPTRPT